jgi:hypothetical protein
MAYFFSNLYQDDSCILLLHSKQPTKMAFHHQNANSKLARSADHLYNTLLCKQTYATWAVHQQNVSTLMPTNGLFTTSS